MIFKIIPDKMKKFFCLILVNTALQFTLFAQEKSALFSSNDPIEIKMKFSVKELKSQTNDSTFMDSFLQYKNEKGEWDSVDVELRTRGNFRLKNCYYPPLRMKIKKKDGEGTIFEGNKSLKIVIPCSKLKNADGFIMREYLCYQLYEEVTPYIFETRLIKVTLENGDEKNGEPVQLVGFLIEDDDEVAERFGGNIIKDKKIPATFLQDSSAVRHDFFQMMIGNTDWSNQFSHNEASLQLEGNTVVPLAYDFDMTGLVNPPYAQVSDQVEIEKVTDRLYRGFCRDPQLMQTIRQEFLASEANILKQVDLLVGTVEERDIKFVKGFLEDFFEVLKDDRLFKAEVLDACRSHGS